MRAHDKLGVSDELAAVRGIHDTLDDAIRIKGRVRAVLRDEHGKVKAVRDVENLITTAGRNFIVEQLLATPAASTKPTHMEVGTSGTAAAVGDTTIAGGFGRVALSSKTRSTNVLTMVANWAAGASTGSLQEAGVWDANTSGNLHARATFTAIPKGANDTLQITWTWTIG